MSDSEDWRLYQGTTLGAATLVKARLHIKGLHIGCAGDYPDDYEGWSGSDWCPRAVANGTAGQAVGRDLDWGVPAQERGGTRLHRTRTHVTSAMARQRFGWESYNR